MTKTPYVLLALAWVVSAGQDPNARSPAPEVVETSVKLDLPSPPAFEEPKGYPDGTHSVTEMRRRSKKFLDQVVTVKGYVVWVYDCSLALGPQVAKDNPERCDKPNFYLADTADASQDKTIWVVEVPRPPREDEKKFLPEEDLKNWPEVPVIEPNKMYKVEGTWALKSPRGFVNSDGLLVYGKLTPAE